MSRDYDFAEIEGRWSKQWAETNPWAAPERPGGDKKYAVTMFPYPSGDLHMGHVEIFSIHDALSRFWRMQGHVVLNPIGWDAFGLPAENAAIKRGIHPKKWTYENIGKHKASMIRLGYSFDWGRIFHTCDPEFYKWNQWFFIRFFERGLAYRKDALANWCPNDKTVLANEQVVAGRCERCDALVEKRLLTQWFFKITDYADRLIDDMELNEGWTEHLKMLQRNWIGRSTGAEVNFQIEGLDDPVTVFTTRPDTLWGATFFVVAPEHPLADKIVAGTDHEARLAAFRTEVGRLTEIDRMSTDRPKRGIPLGKNAINPVNGEPIPIWAADYVLMDYGTGAIMAVPAHDQRDFEFATTYDIPIRQVIRSHDAGDTELPHAGQGVMMNSGPFDGTDTSGSVDAVTGWLQAQGLGSPAVNFRLRDWLISRQRYWGTPIPIIHCPACGEVPVPDADLPVELPEDVDFNPTGDGSPLAAATDWVETQCPKCGGAARRDTDTMDTFMDSSWYFHRYLDPHNDSEPFSRELSDAWMAIDQYSGGITHAVMHLIYARFFQKVLMDMGLAKDPEPFPRLLNQGMVTMGGKAMSKSRGNIVEPIEAFERFGADSLRLYMLFSGPPEQDFDWPTEGVAAIDAVAFRWLQRVWRLCDEVAELPPSEDAEGPDEVTLRRAVHRTIKVVTADYETFSFNTAIARLMELVNDAYRYLASGGRSKAALDEVVDNLLKMLAPITPFITEERWTQRGHPDSVHQPPWPSYDEKLAAQDEVTMVVQINGKVRATITVPATISADEMLEQALADANVERLLDGRKPEKVITKPPKMVSLVVRD